MRAYLKPAIVALFAAVYGCSGASTPSSHSGDARTPATAGMPAAGGAPAPHAKSAPRKHVSDEEARRARPDLPPDRRALLIVGQAGQAQGGPGGEERWIDADAAEGAGYTLLDL